MTPFSLGNLDFKCPSSAAIQCSCHHTTHTVLKTQGRDLVCCFNSASLALSTVPTYDKRFKILVSSESTHTKGFTFIKEEQCNAHFGLKCRFKSTLPHTSWVDLPNHLTSLSLISPICKNPPTFQAFLRNKIHHG